MLSIFHGLLWDWVGLVEQKKKKHFKVRRKATDAEQVLKEVHDGVKAAPE